LAGICGEQASRDQVLLLSQCDPIFRASVERSAKASPSLAMQLICMSLGATNNNNDNNEKIEKNERKK
jgi:hypothetical protein